MKRTVFIVAMVGALVFGVRFLSRSWLRVGDAPGPEAYVHAVPPGPAAPVAVVPPVVGEPIQEEPTPQAPATPPGRGIVAEWTGRPLVSLSSLARTYAGHTGSSALRVPVRLNAGRLVHMLVGSYQPTEPDGGVFSGRLEDVLGSTVVMSYVGDAQSGVVLIPAEHRAFNFRSGDDGVLRVTELDTLNAPDCGAESGHSPSGA